MKDVITKLEQGGTSMDELFINAEAWFEGLPYSSICFNKSNGNTDMKEYFNTELYDERYTVETHQRINRQLSFVTLQIS